MDEIFAIDAIYPKVLQKQIAVKLAASARMSILTTWWNYFVTVHSQSRRDILPRYVVNMKRQDAASTEITP
jgi:hypothetical protein